MKRFLTILMILVVSLMALPTLAISETQKETIADHCESIKTSLRMIQRNDSKARVFLGAYYETIMSKFIMPFNVKLVEKSLSNADFVENQNDFTETKLVFANDFTKYQKMLEDLISIDCKNEPERFYNELTDVRKRRKTMEQDVLKMRQLISEHIKLIDGLKGTI